MGGRVRTVSLVRILKMPLSDDDYGRLGDLLERHSSYDTDGILGLLHAVALAPGIVAPSNWLPVAAVVAPSAVGIEDEVSELVGLLVRLHNEVLNATNSGQAIAPDEDDEEGCFCFAQGYCAGASLDPWWTDDAARWTFAAPFAYLARRLDLLSDEAIAKHRAIPETEALIRNQMMGILAATHSSFRKFRQDLASAQAALRAAAAATTRVATSASRVGRNDPCPCASGKKYKRCCLDRRTVSALS